MSKKSQIEFYNYIKEGNVEKVKEFILNGEPIPSLVSSGKPNDNVYALEWSAQLNDNEIFYLLYKKIRGRYQEKVDTLIAAMSSDNYEVAEFILKNVKDLFWKIPFKNIIEVIKDKQDITGFMLLNKYEHLKDLQKYEIDPHYILKEVSSNMNVAAFKFVLNTVSEDTLTTYITELSKSYGSTWVAKEIKENIINLLCPILITHLYSIPEKNYNKLIVPNMSGLHKDILDEVNAMRLYRDLNKNISNAASDKKLKL